MEEFTLETTVQNFENAALKIVNDLKFGKNDVLKIVSLGHDLENVELNIANFEALTFFSPAQISYLKVPYVPQNYIAKGIGILETLESLDF